ncbi:hypothetical protein WG68_07235 [Arsukibacterium ikkense]|uniref:Lipoprotein n=1 Tax=Arsukibacterium ikkense TaxID=336831 RepID=A0A0M2V6X2_9GAMM|nr:DUF885 domain-containing protein [Arsukibacterium ikkense]KKO46139.1 hypothetical protein WG68_07235 [Arsukibacterium ikkense]
MKTYILGFLVCSSAFVTFPACTADTAIRQNVQTVQRESARLNQWFEDTFRQQQQQSPMQLSRAGSKQDYDKLDDFSEQALIQRQMWLDTVTAQMIAEFNPELLDTETRTSYDLWLYQQQMAEQGHKFRHADYIFNQMFSLHASLPQFLINSHRVETEQDMWDYISRLNHLGRAISQLTERAAANVEHGVIYPAFALQAIAEQSKRLLTGQPFNDGDAAPLWQDTLSKITGLQQQALINDVQADALKKAAQKALLQQVAPAYQQLINWSNASIALAPPINSGIWQRPNGKDYYAYQLAFHTSTKMTAEAIHQLGLTEVKRLTAEMDQLKQQLKFTGSLADFFNFIRQDPRFFYPDTDEGRQAYLADSRSYLAKIEQKLPDYFGLLPSAPLEVRRVEAYREQAGAAQHYMAGSPDGSTPGVYYAHLADMAAMPKPEMEAIAYHEGLPGHHLQISIAQQLLHLPTFRRSARSTVYTEGWALYAEFLAKEMGAYQDPYNEFGRLMTEIWRAVRLVVDTGLHEKQWTEQQAVDYFRQYTPINDNAIIAEVQRYLMFPGQATAFKIGMNEILSMRSQAQAHFKDEFDIVKFHDIVLGGAALPLHLLQQRIDSWIAADQRQAD